MTMTRFQRVDFQSGLAAHPRGTIIQNHAQTNACFSGLFGGTENAICFFVGRSSILYPFVTPFLSEIMHANLARQFCQGNVAFPLETCLCPTPVVNNLPDHVQLLENMAANRFADISRVDIHG